MAKRVFVTGIFDLLHSGHIAFFEAAAQYGVLTVAVGSDRTVYDLKGRAPVLTEDERCFMVGSVGCVDEAFVSSGVGILDFEPDLRRVQPDMFIVNEDGNTPAKRALCAELGIEYIVLQREPHGDLPPRSSTALRNMNLIPYRVDLAGGWLDQPFVSQFYPGPVLTISIEPTIEFNERSGMASSTRRVAVDMWGSRLPNDDPQKLGKILFACDNPPGTEHISGSQDAIGITVPGVAKSHYAGAYWPESMEIDSRETTLQFVEQALYLVPLGPRYAGYNPLNEQHISPAGARALAEAAEACWDAIQQRDLAAFGAAVRASFLAQVAMFPHMSNPMIEELIDQYRDRALGWKLSGAGGGGYLILVAAEPIPKTVRITARRVLD